MNMLQHPQNLSNQQRIPTAMDSFDFDPRTLLRRRSSLVVADLPTRETIRTALAEGAIDELKDTSDEDELENKKEKKDNTKKKPTMFNEPDANSLLDSFGF